MNAPKPGEPIHDTVLSRGKRCIRALIFIVVGYLVYYVVIDLFLFRPIIGNGGATLLAWVFGVVWTLIGVITLVSIYLPDMRKHSVLEPVVEKTDWTQVQPLEKKDAVMHAEVVKEPVVVKKPVVKKTVKKAKKKVVKKKAKRKR